MSLLQEALAYLATLSEQANQPPAYYPQGLRPDKLSVRLRVRSRLTFDLRCARQRKRRTDEEEHGGYWEDWDWDREVRGRFTRAVVVSDPGMGKSWLLRGEAVRYARKAIEDLRSPQKSLEAITIPILLRLPDVAMALSGLPCERRRLPEAIVESLRGFGYHTEFDAGTATISSQFLSLLKDRLETRKSGCILLLDSLDEVPDELRSGLLETLGSWCESDPSARVIVTSRVAGYERPWRMRQGSHTELELELLPFERKQMEEFVSRFLVDDPTTAARIQKFVTGYPQIQRMCQTPLLLGLICAYLREAASGLDLATLHRVDVCELILRRMLQPGFHGDLTTDIPSGEADNKMRMLQRTALRLFAAGQELFPAGDFCAAFEEAAIGDHQRHFFLDIIFQEYLTARAMAEAARSSASFDSWFAQEIVPRLYDYRWREVLAMLGGTLDDDQAFAYLENMRRRAPEDIFLRPLVIACHAVAELPARLPPERNAWVSDLSQTVTTLFLKADTEWLVLPMRQAISALGERALEHLRPVLDGKDSSRSVRQKAAMALGWTKSPAAIPCLIVALADEAWDVRMSAAGALKVIEDRAAVPALLQALWDQDEDDCEFAALAFDFKYTGNMAEAFGLSRAVHGLVRRAAVEALGRIRDPTAIPVLLRALVSEGVDTRKAAAWALGAIKDSAAVPALLAALGDEDMYVRANAAWALGKIKDTAALPGILQASRDTAALVRRATALALGEIKDAATVPVLFQLLGDQRYEVNTTAAIALGEIDSPAIFPALLQALRDENWQVRRNATWTLGLIKDPAAVPALSRLLADGDRVDREYVSKALGEIKDPTAVPALLKALGDEDRQVREKAAKALGKIGDSSAMPALVQALEDEQENVRAVAAAAFGTLGKPTAIPALLRALKDEHQYVRADAAKALGEIGEPAAVPALLQALTDERDYVRGNAAEALGRLKNPVAMTPLLLLLTGENASVRESAAKALAWLGAERGIGNFVEILPRDLSKNRWNLAPEAIRAIHWLGVES